MAQQDQLLLYYTNELSSITFCAKELFYCILRSKKYTVPKFYNRNYLKSKDAMIDVMNI